VLPVASDASSVSAASRSALGLTYNGCYCGTAYYVTLGYEFLDWFNIQQIRRSVVNNGQITILNSQLGQRVGFQGLFVGAGFQF
jgi:hypothetical protein